MKKKSFEQFKLKGLHRLMYGLLYPAVLGTVFVLFISKDIQNFQFIPRTLFGILFLFHWSSEYINSTKNNREKEYKLFDFLGGLVLIIGMYFSFYSLYNERESFTNFYFWVLIIAISFLFTNLLNWLFGLKQVLTKIFWIDICLAMFSFCFWIISIIYEEFSFSREMVFIFMSITFITSVLTYRLQRKLK